LGKESRGKVKRRGETNRPEVVTRRKVLSVITGSAGLAAGYPLLSVGKSSEALDPDTVEELQGKEADLVLMGQTRVWDGYSGVEWDESRDVWRLEADFENYLSTFTKNSLSVEYWVRSWPPAFEGGWTLIDTPWQGKWVKAETSQEIQGKTVIFRFDPLTTAENPNVKNAPEYAPTFRKTLKIRLVSVKGPIPPYRLRLYGTSRWNVREINLQTGCEGNPTHRLSVTAYNGKILESTFSEGTSSTGRVKVLCTDHEPQSNDRTILTIHGAKYSFGVSVDDVIHRRGVYVRSFGIFLGDANAGENFTSFMQSGTMHAGEDVISRVSRHPVQTLEKALGQIPRLARTARDGSHPFRYFPLGFTGNREKYGLDFNGNVFISKNSSKAMKEDLARMLWDGDEIYFRLGTGTVPDFREREDGADQSILEGHLPFVATQWNKEGIEYQQDAYATMLDAVLDENQIRGDEPSVLLLRLRAENSLSTPQQAKVWFQVTPFEQSDFRDGLFVGTGNEHGPYPVPRLRAALDASAGDLRIQSILSLVRTSTHAPWPAHWLSEASGQKDAAHVVTWSVSLPPQGTAYLTIKIPYRTMVTPGEFEGVKQIEYETRREETIKYWREATSKGMRIQVPDERFNTLFSAVLQHILVSQEKDVKTGYFICPCGTYDYGLFANETDIQVRLLDMRGLHDLAWRCLKPLVELQGSKPFPGRFSDTSAELHGVRVDQDHDYTMGGYNLDHGWTLWTMADHYFFTRDQNWLRSVQSHMLRAANWILTERQATMHHGPDGFPVPEFGLLPPGDLEDNNDWEHWLAVNSYAYLGLKRAAEAIGEIDSAEGTRLKTEAESYQKDIRRAAFRAMSITPAVALRDGTFIPNISPRTSLHGRDLGWIRNVLYGAHALVDCDVFSADEEVTTWILQDYEDNLFMASDSLSVPDRDWFGRGGVALQPNLVNTCISYMKRRELPQQLRAFYNTYAVSCYPDVNAFTEWVPTLGTGGGPFFKTSDESAFLTWLRLMLVQESDNDLDLLFGAPRDWYLSGRKIVVENAATFFGNLSFKVESSADQGFIQANISPPTRNRPKAHRIWLHHPGEKLLSRVEINGHGWARFDSQKEMISLPVSENAISVRAFY
jgi:hypothetical protein